MFVPVSTDAPVYHFPAATIGLIVTNFLAFVLTGFGRPDLVDPWILWCGELHVYQWFTAMFVHAGWLHLAGNMVFLWAFGLVIEGKVGWWKFLLIYLALGGLHFGFQQVLMLGSDREEIRREQIESRGLQRIMDDQIDINEQTIDITERELQFLKTPDHDIVKNMLAKGPILSGAFGASGAIYCLLAISLIWAPKNEISVAGLIGLRPFTFEVPMTWFAVCYVVTNFVLVPINDFPLSVTLLNMLAIAVGGVAGVAIFKLGLVDCEDWDIFAVMTGQYGPHLRDIYGYRTESGKKTKYDEKPKPESKTKEPRQTKLDKIYELIDDGDFVKAAEDLFSYRIANPRAVLDEEELQELCMGLVAEQMFEEAEPLLEEYIEQYPDEINWACIRLAAIQLQHNEQPRAAYRTLRGMNRETLTDRERALGRKISQAAKQQVDAGVKDKEHDF